MAALPRGRMRMVRLHDGDDVVDRASPERMCGGRPGMVDTTQLRVPPAQLRHPPVLEPEGVALSPNQAHLYGMAVDETEPSVVSSPYARPKPSARGRSRGGPSSRQARGFGPAWRFCRCRRSPAHRPSDPSTRGSTSQLPSGHPSSGRLADREGRTVFVEVVERGGVRLSLRGGTACEISLSAAAFSIRFHCSGVTRMFFCSVRAIGFANLFARFGRNPVRETLNIPGAAPVGNLVHGARSPQTRPSTKIPDW